jgi:hypothetical protein
MASNAAITPEANGNIPLNRSRIRANRDVFASLIIDLDYKSR